MSAQLTPNDITRKSIGAILGCMCGDVIGACVEGWSAQDIQRAFPRGLTDFQHHARGFGRYTDDTQMTLALAQSIIDAGGVDPKKVAWAYASHFDAARGYGGMAIHILHHLRQTHASDWETAAAKYTPGLGSYGNGAAMRISPVGIAYRNAPLDVLHSAVRGACVPTHTHPIAIDGAFVLAAAVGWLMHRRPAQTVQQEDQLRASFLEHLIAMARTEGMRDKLMLLSCRLIPLKDQVVSWGTHLHTPEWKKEYALQLELSEGQAFQIKSDSAVAAALCAFVHHGLQESTDHPENAIVAACHYGGDTDTIAAMTGACWGALHGYEALPKHWLRDLENEKMGRYDAIHMAYRLGRMDVR